MDRLDRLSIWAIILLLIISSVLISLHMGEAVPESKKRREMQVFNPVAQNEIKNRARIIKNLMEGMNLEKAEMLVSELKQKYPYEGEPRMLMGDIYLRKQQIIKAVYEYKEAVDLNPDYLDRKTPLFQGRKLQYIVRDALSEVQKKLKSEPDNAAMKKHRKVLYYLQRRIAGSCG